MGKELSLIARGAGFAFAGLIISKVLAYFYRVMVARGLGPTDFGIFSIGVGVIGILTGLAALGLYQGIMHFVARYNSLGDEARARGTILLAFKVQLVSSIIFALALFLLSDYLAISVFHEPDVSMVLKILSFTLPFFVITSSLMIVLMAFKKIEYKVYTRNLIENIAKLCFTGIFLFLGFQLLGVTIGFVISIIVAFATGLYFVQKVFPIFGKGFNAQHNARELLSYSWPLLAVGFFSILMGSIDTVMLGYLSKAYDVGIYNVALPTSNLLRIIPYAIGPLFLPIITGLYAQKKVAKLEKTFKVITRWNFALIFPCLLFSILFSSEILSVMFGPVYAQGAGAMVVLAMGAFLITFFGQSGAILESIKRTKLIFLNTVICGFANVFLNLWLIPLFGSYGAAIIGAALATAFSMVLWGALALAEVFVLTRLHPYCKEYRVPTIAACIAIAFFYVVKDAVPSLELLAFPFDLLLLVLFGCTFLGLYGVLFIVLKGLQPEDLDILKAVEKKTGIRVKFLRNFVKRFT